MVRRRVSNFDANSRITMQDERVGRLLVHAAEATGRRASIVEIASCADRAGLVPRDLDTSAPDTLDALIAIASVAVGFDTASRAWRGAINVALGTFASRYQSERQRRADDWRQIVTRRRAEKAAKAAKAAEVTSKAPEGPPKR